MTSLTLDHAICPALLPAFLKERQPRARAKPKYLQRVHMCALFKKHEGNRMNACAEFAQAVREGLVKHKSNLNKVTKEQYALALWYDGVKKGWLR
jgi:hypothetical protein